MYDWNSIIQSAKLQGKSVYDWLIASGRGDNEAVAAIANAIGAGQLGQDQAYLAPTGWTTPTTPTPTPTTTPLLPIEGLKDAVPPSPTHQPFPPQPPPPSTTGYVPPTTPPPTTTTSWEQQQAATQAALQAGGGLQGMAGEGGGATPQLGTAGVMEPWQWWEYVQDPYSTWLQKTDPQIRGTGVTPYEQWLGTRGAMSMPYANWALQQAARGATQGPEAMGTWYGAQPQWGGSAQDWNTIMGLPATDPYRMALEEQPGVAYQGAVQSMGAMPGFMQNYMMGQYPMQRAQWTAQPGQATGTAPTWLDQIQSYLGGY